MKHYTLRALIHDAKIFNQLRLEYRRSKKERRKNASSGYLASPSSLTQMAHRPTEHYAWPERECSDARTAMPA